MENLENRTNYEILSYVLKKYGEDITIEIEVKDHSLKGGVASLTNEGAPYLNYGDPSGEDDAETSIDYFNEEIVIIDILNDVTNEIIWFNNSIDINEWPAYADNKSKYNS